MRGPDVQDSRGLTPPVQRLVGLIPHVAEIARRRTRGQRVPRVPAHECGFVDAGQRRDDQTEHDHRGAHRPGLARPTAAQRSPRHQPQRDQRRGQEPGRPHQRVVEVEHRGGKREQHQGKGDRDQRQAAQHHRPGERGHQRHEQQPSVTVDGAEPPVVKRGGGVEPVVDAVVDPDHYRGRVAVRAGIPGQRLVVMPMAQPDRPPAWPAPPAGRTAAPPPSG